MLSTGSQSVKVTEAIAVAGGGANRVDSPSLKHAFKGPIQSIPTTAHDDNTCRHGDPSLPLDTIHPATLLAQDSQLGTVLDRVGLTTVPIESIPSGIAPQAEGEWHANRHIQSNASNLFPVNNYYPG